MKNTFLRTIGGTMLAMLMLVMFTQVQVSAQDIIDEAQSNEQTQEDLSTRRENTRKLEGSWNLQVTPRNCLTGIPGSTAAVMQTFMRGGTMIDFGGVLSPSLRTPGQGVWSYQGGRRYSIAFQFFRFNADGTPAGRQIQRGQIEMSRDGNSYTATGMGQILDAGGNVIANTCGTSTATRFE